MVKYAKKKGFTMTKKNVKIFSKTLAFILSVAPFSATPALQADATIVRDSYGMPTIKSGDLKDIARAMGLVQAQDRLWQIFFTVQVANGRAAQYFGSDLIDSDILQHQLNYTEEEVHEQIDAYFTARTKQFYEHYVKGLNDYVSEVNEEVSKMPFELRAVGFEKSNPIPEFTLVDIIRTNQFILQQFSPSSIPSYQLENLGDIETLIANFGSSDAKKIFNDVDPTSKQITSPFTMVPDDVAMRSAKESEILEISPEVEGPSYAQEAKEFANKLRAIKKRHSKSGVPTTGSNGQAIGAAKSATGNPMIRIAPQPNYNQPSDFYQTRVEENDIGLRGNFFTIPTFPMTPNGVFNNYGIGVQVGHLPSNDFLFEPAANATHMRTDIIQVLGEDPIALPIYRSTSGGWVLTNPITPETESILTLRSVYLGKQLRSINIFIESAFATNLSELVGSLLKNSWQSDILLLEGDYADSQNILAFHTGGWTKLASQYDRRLPQGIAMNPAPSNSTYSYDNIAEKPLKDINHPQGYYVSWNSLFKQFAAGSSDTIYPVGVNRMHWLDQYVRSFDTLTFKDLKNIGLKQFVANNNTAYDKGDPDQDADLFVILFKNRFFQAVNDNPTPDRLNAVALLQDFKGDWFDGSLNQILNGSDVSDKRILASVWLNAVANRVLNPYLAGTTREVATATPADPIPQENQFGFTNDITGQANTLSRIFNIASDNTVFFDQWLNNQGSIDQIIVESLDFAITTLGGFNAQPWGQGKRGIHNFDNLVLGTVQTMPMCNVSGCVMVAEFASDHIKMRSILALGQSGEILGKPSQDPQFNPHCFDQQEMFSQLKLRYNPPFTIAN
jgi:hypothetical protein